MTAGPATRLLPGRPRVLVAVVAAATVLQVLLAATDLSPALERHSELLALPAYAGLVAVLRWRVATVHAERDVWQRLSLGALALAVLTLVGALLETVPATHDAGPVLAAWAPLAAYVFLYGGVVRWNRYGTEVADPDNLLTGVAAMLSWVALTQSAVDGFGGPESLTGSQVQPLVVHIAFAQLLFITTLMQRVLGDLRRDVRPVLIAVGFLGIELAACLVLAEVAAPAWGPVAGTFLCLVMAVAATIAPKPARSQPSDAATSMAGAFTVIVIGTGALIASAVGTASAVALVAGGSAVIAGGVRLLMGVRDLAQLTATRAEALTDHLTGLPNRRAVLRRMAEDGGRGPVTVFALLDLDRFKEVNDGLGHAAGDDLLCQVTARLTPVLRTGDLLGRLGGDEFAVVATVEDGASPEETAEHLCRRLRECFVEPFLLEDLAVHVGVSIGVTTGSPTGDDEGTAQLLREADAAMYDAKRGGGGHALYDRTRHSGDGTALTLVEELRAGIGEGQLVLHHQPQVDVGTGRVVGVEALVRWAHPRLGLLAPDRFLDLAEAHGLMGPLTDEVLDQAVRQLAAWRLDDPGLRLSVDLSASTLLDAGLPERLAALLDAVGVPAAALTLEVTEGVLLRDPERTRAVVGALRALGVEISIDDFGTGYCSLAYLRELSVSELKLDPSFTAGLLDDAPTEAIVASIIDLAHRLGLRVVAEGVADEVTLGRLAELGCDLTQGHLHGRPAPAPELEIGAGALRG